MGVTAGSCGCLLVHITLLPNINIFVFSWTFFLYFFNNSFITSVKR